MQQSIPLWLTVVVGTLGISTVVLIVAYVKLSKKLTVFMSGKDGKSLEATMAWLTHKHAEVDDTLQAHREALEFIDRRVKKSVRGYSLVRYDAYEQAGGNQSFASGIIDEHGDGYILSVISNRNHTGIYAKPVSRGAALSSLTQEEQSALDAAKKHI